MRPMVQKVLACAGGLVIFVGAMIWALASRNWASHIVGLEIGLPSEFADGDAVYKYFADRYAILAFIGVALAAGLSFTLLSWERRPRSLLLEGVYWVLLAAALPMTVVNYWGADTFVSRAQQVWLNLALCFLGVLCLTHLLRVRTSAGAATLLKGFVIFLLAFQAVLIPAIYSLLFWLNWQGAIDRSQTESFSPGWISAVASCGALVISVLQYRLAASKERQQRETPPAGAIIIGRGER